MTIAYTYRLTEITYRQRTEWDDGPGSFKHIVSDESKAVMKIWQEKDEDFGDHLIKHGDYNLTLLSDSSCGWYSYNYLLERKKSDDDDWEYVGYLMSNQGDEWECEYDPCEDDHDEEDEGEDMFCEQCEAEMKEEIEKEEHHRCMWCGVSIETEDLVLCDDCDAEMTTRDRQEDIPYPRYVYEKLCCTLRLYTYIFRQYIKDIFTKK